MQFSAMAPAVKTDTPLGSRPHPRLFTDTEIAIAVLFCVDSCRPGKGSGFDCDEARDTGSWWILYHVEK